GPQCSHCCNSPLTNISLCDPLRGGKDPFLLNFVRPRERVFPYADLLRTLEWNLRVWLHLRPRSPRTSNPAWDEAPGSSGWTFPQPTRAWSANRRRNRTGPNIYPGCAHWSRSLCKSTIPDFCPELRLGFQPGELL